MVGSSPRTAALPTATGRLVVVVGTRPEAVKLAPVVAALGPRAVLAHSGQHYSPDLAEAFSAEIGLRLPDVQLTVGGIARTAQIRSATAQLLEWWRATRPVAVVVQGDTNTTLAAALAAHAAGTPIVHVEAGLRSDDRAMPEEHNRIVVDHLSALACAPTGLAADRLRAERVPGAVVMTGNTVVDALLASVPDAAGIDAVLEHHGVSSGAFVLATMHRPENVDHPSRFAAILEALGRSSLPVLFPMHPRARAGLGAAPLAVRVIDPLPYREFLALLGSCAVCVSDSGGVQEEASVVKAPVLVVRRSTERPEVLGTFARLVPDASTLADELATAIAESSNWRSRLRDIASPYGSGHATPAIIAAIESHFAF